MRKKFIALGFLLLILTGCTESTEYGECIGLGQDKDPELVYRLDKSNAFVAIIFVETIIVPILVLADNIYCPVGQK